MKSKGMFSKNVLVLMAGTFLSQLLPFLIAPILTRIFSPAEFGMFGLYFSISMVLSVFITARYEMAIMLPKSDTEAANLVGLCFLITTGISVLLLLLVVFFKGFFASYFNSPQLENWLFVLPATMFAIGTYQALNYWNNRKEKYTRLAISRVARSVNTSGWSIAFGFIPLLKKGGLILGDAVGQLVASAFLFFRTWKNDGHLYKEINRPEMYRQASRYNHFLKFNVVSGLFEKLSGQMPVFFLAYFFGETISGFFSFSQRIVSAPSAIIARAFGDVFRQKATVAFHEKGNCTELFNKTFLQLLTLSVVPFILFGIFAPPVFAFLFGEEWRVAGEYAQWLTPMFFLQFIVSPVSNMFLVAEKQKIDLYLQIFLLAAVTGAFLLGYNLFGETRMCLIFFTFAYSAKYLVELYLSYQFSKGKSGYE